MTFLQYEPGNINYTAFVVFLSSFSIKLGDFITLSYGKFFGILGKTFLIRYKNYKKRKT